MKRQVGPFGGILVDAVLAVDSDEIFCIVRLALGERDFIFISRDCQISNTKFAP